MKNVTNYEKVMLLKVISEFLEPDYMIIRADEYKRLAGGLVMATLMKQAQYDADHQ